MNGRFEVPIILAMLALTLGGPGCAWIGDGERDGGERDGGERTGGERDGGERTGGERDGAAVEREGDGPTENGVDVYVEPSAEIAPRPFTADEIRDAYRVGSWREYRIDSATRPSIHQRVLVTEADDETVEFAAQLIDEHGTVVPGSDERQRARWTELRDHATFPAAQTTRMETRLTTPAGDFDCWLYEVTDPESGAVSRFYFSRNHPGAPVQYSRHERDGAFSTNVLVDFGIRDETLSNASSSEPSTPPESHSPETQSPGAHAPETQPSETQPASRTRGR